MWTAERIERLTNLWAEGWSASQIAGRLGGITRNAVIGKVHRLGLPSRRMRQSSRSAAHALASRRRKPKERPWRPVLTPRVLVLPQAEPVPMGLALLDLTPCTCRWPYGDPKDNFGGFCGHTVAPGETYCPHHYRKSRG